MERYKWFQIRLSVEKHSRIKADAARTLCTMQEWIEEAIDMKIKLRSSVAAEGVSADDPEPRVGAVAETKGAVCKGRPWRDTSNPSKPVWRGGQRDAPYCFADQCCEMGDSECKAACGYGVNPENGELIDLRDMVGSMPAVGRRQRP